MKKKNYNCESCFVFIKILLILIVSTCQTGWLVQPKLPSSVSSLLAAACRVPPCYVGLSAQLEKYIFKDVFIFYHSLRFSGFLRKPVQSPRRSPGF